MEPSIKRQKLEKHVSRHPRDTCDRCARQPRAYVLETDLGWDPDDILALLVLWRHCKRTCSPLAVLTSAEVPSAARAKIVRLVLRGLGVHDHDADVVVAAGFPCRSRDPERLNYKQPVARGLLEMVHEAEAKDQIPVGNIDDIKAFLRRHSKRSQSGVDDGNEYSRGKVDSGISRGSRSGVNEDGCSGSGGGDGGGGGGGSNNNNNDNNCSKSSCTRSSSHNDDGIEPPRRGVIWVGIGAMSGLAAVLSDITCPNPSCVLQQGVGFPQPKKRVSTNIYLDPMAALSTLHGCHEAGVPLHFISSDTTRVDLRWQEPGPSYEAPLPAALRPLWDRQEYAAAAAAILCNADASVRSDDSGGGAGGVIANSGQNYVYGSSLHDPYTVLAAIDGCCCGNPPLSYVPSVRVDLSLESPSGEATRIAVQQNDLVARSVAVKGHSEGCDWFWGHSSADDDGDVPYEKFKILESKSTTATMARDCLGNCKMTLGVLSPTEVAEFACRLRDELVPTEARGTPPIEAILLAKQPLRRTKALSKDAWSKNSRIFSKRDSAK